MQSQAQSPTLKKIKFGIIPRRWWKRNDHLVIVGHNKADESFFVFDPRQLNARVKELPGLFSGPKKKTEALLKSVEGLDVRFWRNDVGVCEYEGTLHVTELAISFRHFMFVEVDYLPPMPKLGHVKLDLAEPLSSCVGRYHAPIVAGIIAKKYPGTTSLLSGEFPDLTKKAA